MKMKLLSGLLAGAVDLWDSRQKKLFIVYAFPNAHLHQLLSFVIR